MQLGYSAGARSAPKFDWVRNIVRERSFPIGTREERDRESSCAFALLWNLARNKVPAEVIADLEQFAEDLKIGRMDDHGTMAGDGGGAAGMAGTIAGAAGSTGTYSLQSGENIFTFHGVELAPPTGVMAANYARCAL